MLPNRIFAIAILALCVLSSTVGTARADIISDPVDVFLVGCSGSPALDPGGIALPCSASVSWVHDLTFDPVHLKEATLAILAEGIDAQAPGGSPGPEIDHVFINGNFVGNLTNQSIYSPLFNLQPGPGALPGITELTLSFFDVTPFIVSGVNTIRVDVDPTNWVLEIERSGLSARVPEPATLGLFVLGLAGLGLLRRRTTP